MGKVVFSAPRQLEEKDVLEGFSCGVEMVDSWLSSHAKGARKAGTAVVYVSFAGPQLAGFYSLSSQSIQRGLTRGWLARNAPQQIPVILLGMLGVDIRFQKQGLGHNLLLDAVHRAQSICEHIGARALVVDPADASSRAFYTAHGFIPLPNSKRMFAKLG